MSYLALKHLHLALAGLAGLVYVVRGVLMIARSPVLESRLMRVLPHVVYTLLLVAGVSLATWSGQWNAAWIWIKLALLVAFVVLGALAFKRNSTLSHSRRITVWGMGLLVFIMIGAVAAHHHARMQVDQPLPAGVPATSGA